MYASPKAEYPDQPSSVNFDYLDVNKVARATFSGNILLDVEIADSWDEPQNSLAAYIERTQGRR